MKKKVNKWVWIALAAVAVIGIIVAVVLLTQQNKEPVFVYSFSDGIVGMSDYYYGGNDSSGMVTTDRIQTVYLTDTQTVLEVNVTDGQEVKMGDVLFTYDTTLSDITLRQKELSVQQSKLDLETAKQELAVINSYVPISYHEVEEPEPAEPVASLADFDLTGKDYLAFSGSGTTSLTPKYCWLRSSTMVDDTMIAALFADAEGDVLFVRFQHTQDDSNDGEVTDEYGIKLMRLAVAGADGSQSYTYRFSFFDPNANAGPVDDGIDWNSGYTAAEIASMRSEKQEEIKNLEFQIKVAEAEYSIMQKEADSGEVKAEFDGTVVGLQDAEMALLNNEPFLKVSGGGGFYVTGSVSELELGNIQLGQKVSVMSWDNYQTYEGTIVEIQQFPQENEYDYYGGSQNVSYYPYKIFIDESADLQDGYYVSMTLQAGEGQGGLYIDNAFVRSEGASNYVYVRSADGTLEKRAIQLGSSLWGSYSEVLGGLTGDDWLAFPYGKTVKEGAPTQEGTWEDLHN